MIDSAELAEQLRVLDQAGVPALERPALGLVKRLVAGAARLDGPAAARLLARAEQRLGQLRQQLERARARATGHAEQLEALGVDGDHRGAVAHGDHERLARLVRRYPRGVDSDVYAVRRAVARRMGRLAKDRGISRELAFWTSGADQHAATDEGLALAERMYQRSAATASTALALVKAEQGIPKDPGRYHASLVAAAALRAMRAMSPEYLYAHLARLEDLASLQGFVAAELAQQPAPRQRGRGGRKVSAKRPARA